MFRFECPMRWSDLDAQGHINNAVLVDYLQEARVAFLCSGPAAGLLSSGVIVVNHQVAYQRLVTYTEEPLAVELTVAQLGGARIVLAYEIWQAGQLTARARTVLCPFDFAGQRPVRLSAAHREFFTSHLTPAEPWPQLPAAQLAGRGTHVPLIVRWSDLDAYGHVNNAMVYDYLQQARISVTTTWAPEMARAGAGHSSHLWLIARQDVDYVAQLGHRLAPYVVRVGLARIGTTSITLASEIADPDAGTVFNRARTVLVCADATGTPKRLPDSLRQRLTAQLL